VALDASQNLRVLYVELPPCNERASQSVEKHRTPALQLGEGPFRFLLPDDSKQLVIREIAGDIVKKRSDYKPMLPAPVTRCKLECTVTHTQAVAIALWCETLSYPLLDFIRR
jgi:hypothetical protein